jgi:hypothetical protein
MVSYMKPPNVMPVQEELAVEEEVSAADAGVAFALSNPGVTKIVRCVRLPDGPPATPCPPPTSPKPPARSRVRMAES